MRSPRPNAPRPHRGATLVEMVVVMPTLLFLVLAIWQTATAFQAKSALNYATFEAARAGSVAHASVDSMTTALRKAMLPYYGGGRNVAELVQAADRAAADLGADGLRIEIISPSQESFQDYNSPALQKKYNTNEPVIPNAGIDELKCPRDPERADCSHDPASNASGQTLQDANLLKLRVTFGIPQAKQMPLVGPLYTWALNKMGAGEGDAFKQGLLNAGRIPIVSHVVLRMQSDAIRNANMLSNAGPGNSGKPVDPGPPPDTPDLPNCPYWDPSCGLCRRGQDCTTPPPPDTCGG